MSRDETISKWCDLIKEQMQSGQTQSVWCTENDINIHTFRYWKKRLSEHLSGNESSATGFIALKPAIQNGQSVKVHIGAARLEIYESSNLALIDDVIKVLMRYA